MPGAIGKGSRGVTSPLHLCSCERRTEYRVQTILGRLHCHWTTPATRLVLLAIVESGVCACLPILFVFGLTVWSSYWLLAHNHTVACSGPVWREDLWIPGRWPIVLVLFDLIVFWAWQQHNKSARVFWFVGQLSGVRRRAKIVVLSEIAVWWLAGLSLLARRTFYTLPRLGVGIYFHENLCLLATGQTNEWVKLEKSCYYSLLWWWTWGLFSLCGCAVSWLLLLVCTCLTPVNRLSC